MNSKPSTSKSTTFNETKENNTASKLRRLKIEENILLQCLKKHEQKNNYEMTELDTVSDSDCKIMMKNLKDAYIKIKNLFDDIKIITNSQELLADVGEIINHKEPLGTRIYYIVLLYEIYMYAF